MCNVWAECTVGWTLWALHSLTCPLPRSKLVFGKIPWGAPVKRKQFTSRYSKAIDCPCLIKGPAESVQRQKILTNNGHVVVICGFWLARFFSNLCHFRIPKNPRECRMRLFFTLACFCCLSTMTPVGAKIVQRGGEKKHKKNNYRASFSIRGFSPQLPLGEVQSCRHAAWHLLLCSSLAARRWGGITAIAAVLMLRWFEKDR